MTVRPTIAMARQEAAAAAACAAQAQQTADTVVADITAVGTKVDAMLDAIEKVVGPAFVVVRETAEGAREKANEVSAKMDTVSKLVADLQTTQSALQGRISALQEELEKTKADASKAPANNQKDSVAPVVTPPVAKPLAKTSRIVRLTNAISNAVVRFFTAIANAMRSIKKKTTSSVSSFGQSICQKVSYVKTKLELAVAHKKA